MNDILAKMQGTWLIVTALESGEAVAQGEARLVIAGDAFARQTPEHVFQRRVRVQEQLQGPAWLDLEVKNEPGTGTVFLGLVDIVDDRMRICHAHPGAPRPKDFSSTSENHNILSVSCRE